MKEYKFKISNRYIKKNSKSFLIAEVGQAHNGNIKKVFKFIDKVSSYKIDAIKFQTHIASEESTYDEPFRKKIRKFQTRFEYWKSVEFTQKQWKEIKNYCHKKNIIFLSSVFSIKSVKLLSNIGLKTWKIGSGERDSFDIFNYLKKYKKNDSIIISTGLMDNKTIKKIYKFFNKKNPLCLMHCVSEYPAKLKKLGINNLEYLQKKYPCIIGYSDHSGSIYPLLFAISKSIPIIEFHVKFKDDKNNPDSSSSISVNDLPILTEANNAFYELRKNKIDKQNLSSSQKKMIKIFTKSLSFKKDMFKNEIINKNDLILKKPGNGIKFDKISNLIGKKLTKNVSKNRLIKYTDIKK